MASRSKAACLRVHKVQTFAIIRKGGNTSSPARNVLIDNNTLLNAYECNVAIVNISDRWAMMNNIMNYSSTFVCPVDLEPWQEASYITNIEIGYNKITRTNGGSYNEVIQTSGWFDSTPGENVYIHHTYGSWPNTPTFLNNNGKAGYFKNVVATKNAQGNSPPL